MKKKGSLDVGLTITIGAALLLMILAIMAFFIWRGSLGITKGTSCEDSSIGGKCMASVTSCITNNMVVVSGASCPEVDNPAKPGTKISKICCRSPG